MWISRREYELLRIKRMQLDELLNRTARIELLLRATRAEVQVEMSKLTDSLDDMEAQVRGISDAEESAEAAFLRLAQTIEDLKAQTDPATAARIQAAADELRARAARLAAAVTSAPADDTATADAGASGPTGPTGPTG